MIAEVAVPDEHESPAYTEDASGVPDHLAGDVVGAGLLLVERWVADDGVGRGVGDMAEVALPHKIINAVEASYRRGDMIEKRRRMMADWADYLGGTAKAGQVVRIG